MTNDFFWILETAVLIAFVYITYLNWLRNKQLRELVKRSQEILERLKGKEGEK